ncbi:LPD7 domain-containing protein [Roseateles saccharophilus]|uniref:Large polyvalent protein-associated domain-containing protein n=1 Tax=Roseateles saccharophilus TaxID=304 RepID=A0A4R3UHH8_ROSSA|nr:hypothetical protein EV671_103925 [Roseateles saccharophilus]
MPSRPSAPSLGRAVEPAQRSGSPSPRAPDGAAAERYELRDPVVDVIHRAEHYEDMVARTELLGSKLFVAVAMDGKRTSIEKRDGQWRRGPQRPASAAHAPDAKPVLAQLPEAGPLVSTLPGDTRRPHTAPVEERPTPRQQARDEQAALAARLEAGLLQRYVIRRTTVTVGDATLRRTEYRSRGDRSRVAFTESTFRLATDTNSPSVARSMVDVAEARHWKGLRVSGHEDFKRMVWLEASARGLKTQGFEPTVEDLALLRRESEARRPNRVEHLIGKDDPFKEAQGGGRSAMLAAIEAVLVPEDMPVMTREAEMPAAAEKLAQRVREGQMPRVRIYDKAAPAQRTATVGAQEPQRNPERATTAPRR